MPAPYPLLEIPPGDVKDIFDSQAINMACAHNTFLQGVNAMVYHAHRIQENQVQDFMVFCIALVGLIHHHHDGEEEFLFPELEKKLGEGALHANVDQHAEFLPQLHDFEEYITAIQNGKQQYNGDEFVGKIGSFSDKLVQHLNDEIPTIESKYLEKHFTRKELKAIDDAFIWRAIKNVTFNTTIPVILVCANPATPWFPPLPGPLLWAVRVWFSRKYAAAWEFGPCDINGKPKERAD
jgi:hemerythrin-like domain-containing protein